MKKISLIDKVPEDIHKFVIRSFVDQKSLSILSLANKRSYTLFQPARLLEKFLQKIAYGRQDKIEELFDLLKKQKRNKDIQELLRASGKMADYSGRIFNCTAYEYAFWAKDTHMCRMLESHMDDNTKAAILKRCEAIEKDGLKYKQYGKERCSKHFTFTELVNALKEYVTNRKVWYTTRNLKALSTAWIKVGIAQRDAPAHVIHEYCREDRSFVPTPQFNEKKLPRKSIYWNHGMFEELYPFSITESSGLGVSFALHRDDDAAAFCLGASSDNCGLVRNTKYVVRDLLAVTELDKCRSKDIEQSLANLQQKKIEGYKLEV